MCRLPKALVCSLLVVCVMGTVVDADCPSCYSDMRPLNVSGNGTQGTRPIITVQIATSGSGSWNVDDSGNPQGSTNAHVWNAVQGCDGCVPPDGAIGMWNKAPDNGTLGGPYFFKLDQSTTTPTIKIIRKPNLTDSCAETTAPT